MPTDAPEPPKDSATTPETPISEAVRHAPFPYMRWAKQCLDPSDTSSLGLSGLSGPGRAADGATASPIVGPVDPVLKQAIADRYDLEPENVHLASGSSAANFLVYHVYARGGRVAAETPAYEALHRLAPAVGATLSTFERDPARGWRVDVASLDRAVAGGVDLIAVTDLHNPSGARLAAADLDHLIGVAETNDAVVVVDEVYLDFDPVRRPTAAHRSDRVLSTNSLTKAHGLGPLRAGWMLGSADRIQALAEADDLVNPVLPAVALEAALAYLPHADACLEETRATAQARTDTVDAWVAATPGVTWTRPDGGITGFLDLPGVDGERFCAELFDAHGVRAVPGSFFDRPEGVRISYLIEQDALDRALRAMAVVLEAYA